MLSTGPLAHAQRVAHSPFLRLIQALDAQYFLGLGRMIPSRDQRFDLFVYARRGRRQRRKGAQLGVRLRAIIDTMSALFKRSFQWFQFQVWRLGPCALGQRRDERTLRALRLCEFLAIDRLKRLRIVRRLWTRYA